MSIDNIHESIEKELLGTTTKVDIKDLDIKACTKSQKLKRFLGKKQSLYKNDAVVHQPCRLTCNGF